MTVLARTLKQAREDLGLRQRDLAAELGEPGNSGQVTIARYESAVVIPSADRMVSLVQILGLEEPAIWQVWAEAQMTEERIRG